MALDRELDLASELPIEQEKEYLGMRRDFFDALVAYCRTRPSDYSEDDIDEMSKTKEDLERICEDREI